MKILLSYCYNHSFNNNNNNNNIEEFIIDINIIFL
jgi:hypothetical protein